MRRQGPSRPSHDTGVLPSRAVGATGVPNRWNMQESNVLTAMSQLSSGSGDLLTLRNVLMCTDFSDCSTRALVCALRIATRYEAQLHVLHCIDPRPYKGEPGAIHTARDAAWRDMRSLESDQ